MDPVSSSPALAADWTRMTMRSSPRVRRNASWFDEHCYRCHHQTCPHASPAELRAKDDGSSKSSVLKYRNIEKIHEAEREFANVNALNRKVEFLILQHAN